MQKNAYDFNLKIRRKRIDFNRSLMVGHPEQHFLGIQISRRFKSSKVFGFHSRFHSFVKLYLFRANISFDSPITCVSVSFLSFLGNLFISVQSIVECISLATSSTNFRVFFEMLRVSSIETRHYSPRANSRLRCPRNEILRSFR